MKSWEYRLQPLEQRLQNYTVDPITECHVFNGRRDGKGYAQVKHNGTAILVHRYLWMQKYGELTRKQHVLHRCDNPACINLDHLFLGDHKANMEDKKAKGRSKNVPRGFAHKRPMAKITEEQARAIKSLLARCYRQCDIARDFQVSRQIVNDIALKKTWTHLDGA